MDAKELNDLCEPLFKAWPECEPAGLVRGNMAGDPERPAFLYGSPRNQIPPDLAAALIRVGIEDTLAANLWFVTWNGLPMAGCTDPLFSLIVEPRDGSGDESAYAGDGPTLLHALVAAALAVASSRRPDDAMRRSIAEQIEGGGHGRQD